MNIITGITRPLRNCALKPASCRASLRSAKAASASAWRPKTRTSSWPENVSSMWALRCPVERHWLMNCPCDRFMTARATSIEIGTETSAMSASSG